MKRMIIIISIATVLILTFFFMSYATNRKTERQQYNLVKKENGFEIRFYPRAIMATVLSEKTGEERDANPNFRRLAGYIFGGNKHNQKIAMTAPVYMEQDSEKNKMSFVLPSSYKIADLPDPNDSTINLHYSEEGYFAALRFGGFANTGKIRAKEQELKELLTKAGYSTTGSFKYLGYNAPWDIINHENDVIVMISYNDHQ